MILGLRTVIYPVTDMASAKAWYQQVLDIEPYFDQPFYVGFAVGGFELGLTPEGEPGPGGATAYWGVLDAGAELERLVKLGAVVHDSIKDVGDGIKVATFKDPCGNLFGIIENPHFKIEQAA